jgi:hypothetical protein
VIVRWAFVVGGVALLGACRDAPRVEQIAAPETPAAIAPGPAPAEPVAVFEPDLKPTLDKIAARVPKISWNSELSIGVSWLPTAKRWSIRGDEPQVMASIGKVVWTAAALARAPADSVEPLAVAAFAYSDNEGGASLIDLAGGADAVNLFTAGTLSIAPTAMSLCTYNGGAMPRVAERCHRIEGIDAFFTIHSSLTLLEAIWRGAPPLDGERRQKLLQWSQLEPPLGFTMKRYLPKHVAVHHKRAEIPAGCCGKGPRWNWTADVGIVESPRGPYAFAISLSHGDSYPNQPETVEWASCVVYRAVVSEDDATCPQPGT